MSRKIRGARFRTLMRALRSARTRAVLSLGVVLSVGVTGTFAYWTDAVAIAGTSFTAGTIDVKVNSADALPTYTSLNLATMVPGNSTAAVFNVTNAGTAALKYSIATAYTDTPAVAGNNLSSQLDIKVTAATSVTSPGTLSASCAGTAVAGFATTLTTPLLPAPGHQLNAGAGETFCVQVTLKAAAPTAMQGAKTDVLLTFTGTSDLS